MAVKVGNRVYIIETDMKRLTLGYADYRRSVESFKDVRHVKGTIHSREKQRKRDRQRKLAGLIADTARKLNAIVVVESLPKNAPKNMVKNVSNRRLRHRICQAGFRGLNRP